MRSTNSTRRRPVAGHLQYLAVACRSRDCPAVRPSVVRCHLSTGSSYSRHSDAVYLLAIIHPPHTHSLTHVPLSSLTWLSDSATDVGLRSSPAVEMDAHLFTSSNQRRRLSSERHESSLSVINPTPPHLRDCLLLSARRAASEHDTRYVKRIA